MMDPLLMTLLVIWGNVFLSDANALSRPEFTSRESPFEIEWLNLKFVETNGLGIEELYARGPGNWLTRLKNDGCTRLELHYVGPTNVIAETGFWHSAVDNSYMLIETVGPNGSEYWAVKSKYDRKTSTWQTTFYTTKLKLKQKIEDELIVSQSTAQLRKKLISVQEFAASVGLDGWIKNFQNGVDLIDINAERSDSIEIEYLPNELIGANARSLMKAVSSSWHFGGMGAWDDGGYELSKDQEEEYYKVSAQLYFELHRSLVAVANSTRSQ